MKNNKLILLLLWLSISSCEKVIDPGELPQQEARLVVNCILTNDSVVKVNVSSSKSIISGKEYKQIDNATCRLLENGQLVEQLVNIKNGNYQGKIIPKPDRTYTLKVSAAYFTDVETSTMLPPSVSIEKTERYDTVNSTFTRFDPPNSGIILLGGNMKFKVTLKDDLSKKDYYALRPTITLFDSTGKAIPEQGEVFFSETKQNEEGFVFSNFMGITDGQPVNSNQLLVDFTVGTNYVLEQIPLGDLVVSLQVATISDDLYKYISTANEQSYNSGNWFAEPTMVYSNVSNGMGILGGINNQQIVLFRGKVKKF